MTNEQLYLAIGLPILFNTAVSLALRLNLWSNMNHRFQSINQRFDDMRDVWRAELHREEVLDARLKTFGGAVRMEFAVLRLPACR
jgi:hypothetical protein